ncbi:CinA family protein [Ghiorsea bivora]|uniref:CinA family protein n=1 Tax=Ghiorsea bivora TaxID=1485545 RepID=UPI00056EEC4C|nr:CinA family protein [Ghiorsea bivora]
MNKAQHLIQKLQQNHWQIRCVESCTAGALTAAIGSIAGASSVLDRSWVTYSNQAKHEEVGVPLKTLETYGAVSKEVVLSMAEGAVRGCENHTLSLAVSGIAGPDGGRKNKPVGTVWIACKTPSQAAYAQCFHFKGSRTEIQLQAVTQALTMPL